MPETCVLCGDEIEFLEVETTDAAIRPAWFSRIGGRVLCLTTMCGLGKSEAIPPTQNHRRA